MKIKIELKASASGFAEDKEDAKAIRINQILPSLDKGDAVVLDFSKVKYATQSYIHALIGEPLRRFKEVALARLEFKNCSPQLKSLVELVVDYSLGGFSEESVPARPPTAKGKRAA